MLAPIALFVYNRPFHTRCTIKSLAENILAKDSELIIFSDGPKTESNKEQVSEVRNLVRSISGFRSIRIIESQINKGLANSIISGVTSTLSEYDKVIVLEDDMVTSPQFLSYMNHSLNLYENDEEVISIHGYVYPVKEPLPDYFFIKGADCWGWATWRRGWKIFEPDGKKLLNELDNRKLLKQFDFNGSYPYSKMLRKQIAGKNNSWAIRWYASAFLQEKLTLYPGKSYVQNIGNDASGTHSRATNQFEVDKLNDKLPSARINIKEDVQSRKVIAAYFQSIKINPIQKFLDKMLSLLQK